MRSFFTLFFWIWSTGWVYASVNRTHGLDRVQAPLGKQYRYIEFGQVTGGQAGEIHSLIGMRRVFSGKDRVERLILDLGDAAGKPLLGRVSYFQVSIEKDKPRIIIDLSQMAASTVNDKTIRRLVRSSPFIKSAKVNYDPTDASLTIQLFLKKKMQLEAFQLVGKGKPGRLAVDMKEKM